jgi:3'-phosphoadenosine 5'-phosphosulfate sulfotransferase (PAPS reductase)/FAD synthetase
MPRPAGQQGSLKEGFPKLKRYQAWPLEQKVDYANRMIEEVLCRHRRPAVCWSGGKDSTVLLHLVLQHRLDVDVIYNDTGVEFPETREFVKLVAREWNVNLHVARPKPGETFWDVTKKYGWPILGKEQSDSIEHAQMRLAVMHSDNAHISDGKNDKGPNAMLLSNPDDLSGFGKLSDMERVLVAYNVDVSTRCCKFLKERPTKALELELGIDCKILGILACESRSRSLQWIDHGDYYYIKRYFGKNQGIWKAMPTSIWTEEDVWEYHKRFDLPHCKLYDMGHDRNGCWTCAMGVRFGQLKRLRESHPKLFYYLIVRCEMGREILKAKIVLNPNNLDGVPVEQWVEEVDLDLLLAQRPCFFDTI